MLVFAFLHEINVMLVANKQLMTSIARINGRCIKLIAVAKHNAMKTASYKKRCRNRWAVACSAIHHLVTICIYHSTCDVASPTHSVRTNKK